MPAAKREIIVSFARKVRKILGKNLKQVILYGSYARGDYTEDSDIDIMVLTTLTDKEIEQIETEIYDLAFDYLMDYGVDISVVIKNEEQFNDNVRKEGMVLNG